VVGSSAAGLDGVATDSRRVGPGMLFVALRAERDGHDFVGPAVEAGAGGALVARDWLAASSSDSGPGVPLIAVDDTAVGLLDLGRAARDRLDGGQVVGITGSVGKTSTKDLTAAAVGAGRLVAASEKSFNNEIGVPLTLANAPEATEVAVIEMGARGIGHLRVLCGVARPTIAVVTAVAAAHTSTFGDLDAVAAAKGELVEALPPAGVAVLNADDARVAAMASRTRGGVLRYSARGGAADLVAAQVVVDDDLRPSFVARTPWGDVPVALGARGVHQVGNALAALAVAGACGVDVAAAGAALMGAALSPWRMELGRTPSGAAVLNDAYNANPASMAAALDALAALPASRRIAVLGEMAELGALSSSEHAAVASQAAGLGVVLVAVDTPAYGAEPVEGVEGALAALGGLRPPLGTGDAVLVKASRVVGLERLAARLLEAP
jgi:UDP-N-acetylmuramoyl-tripeptide--D-alanyl-D-alanine ligase